jgi:hypothetical protein
MATNITGDWRELFDVALFEPNRARLRHCIKNAKTAIRERLDALMRNRSANGQAENGQAENDQSENDPSENGRIISERIALSDALTTLAELQKMVYARKSSPTTKREEGSAADQAGFR